MGMRVFLKAGWAQLPESFLLILKVMARSGMTADIDGHWIHREGKKYATKTPRGPKARPGQTLAVITGAKTGPIWCEQP